MKWILNVGLVFRSIGCIREENNLELPVSLVFHDKFQPDMTNKCNYLRFFFLYLIVDISPGFDFVMQIYFPEPNFQLTFN